MQEKYINPFTDFGFKKLFGEESNKDLLIDFLNELLQENGRIIDLTFLKNEHLGLRQEDRRAIFDLYCENDRGEKFIVELQKARQKYFKDRSIYYSTFAIQEQAKTGEWDFQLNTVYTIAIMDFVFDEFENDRFIHDIALIDRDTHKLFYPKLRYIYLEMPKFRKEEKDLITRFDKWLFVLKNLSALQDIPEKVQEKIFLRLFRIAEIANYSPTDREKYNDSVKYYRDIKNSLDFAIEQGIEQGRELGIEQGRELGMEKGLKEKAKFIAIEMKKNGEPIDKISKYTGLTEAEIENL